MTRTEQLLQLRPILALSTEEASAAEKFQNETLRPILKFQNDLVVQFFKNYCVKRKSIFFKMDTKGQSNYIEKTLLKDQKLKQSLIGLIIGFFTVEEYNNYLNAESEYNRRITRMLIKRLQSNLIT